MSPNSSRKSRHRGPLASRQRREPVRLQDRPSANPTSQAKPAGRLSWALDWAAGHFNLLAFFVFLLTFLGAWAIFGVSPLHPLQKIANEQREYDRQEAKRQFVEAVVGRHLKMGCELLNDGLYDKAEKEFAEALILDPTDLRAELGKLKSKVYDFKGKYNHKQFERRVKLIEEECMKLKKNPNDPDDPHVLIFWGDYYGREGSPESIDKAIEYFQRAKNVDENIAEAYFKLGYLYGKKSKHALALENYKKAVEKSKWDGRYLNNLAAQYARMNEHEKAIYNYTKAINMAPDFILPYLELSNVYRWDGKFPEAQKVLHEAVLRFEDQRVAASPENQGGWVLDCDRVPGTVTLLEIPEKQAYTYMSMAFTLHLLDKKTEARSYLQKARSLKLKSIPKVLSVVRQDQARLLDRGKKNSDFLAILNQEVPTSE